MSNIDSIIPKSDSVSVFVTWSSRLVQGSGPFTGPPKSAFHIFRRTKGSSDWQPFLEFQKLGQAVLLGSTAGLATMEYYLQVKITRKNPDAPEAYDMAFSFTDDQGRHLSLHSGNDAVHFSGAVESVVKYGLKIVPQAGG